MLLAKVKEDAFSSKAVTCNQVKDLDSSDSRFCLKYKNSFFRGSWKCNDLTLAWSWLKNVEVEIYEVFTTLIK